MRARPIAQEEHLRTLRRYVARKPLRADLVSRAAAWPWSSLGDWLRAPLLPWLEPGPVPRPASWRQHVHEAHTQAELARLRYRVPRRVPYGHPAWVERTAGDLGLQSRLRPQAGRASAASPTASRRAFSARNSPECPHSHISKGLPDGLPELWRHETQVTAAGLGRLQKALRRCNIKDSLSGLCP